MIVLRPGTSADLEDLARLHGACFSSPWDQVSLAALTAQPNVFTLIATQGGRARGFVMARVAAGESEILSLGVHPQSRGAGTGAQLVHAAATQAAEQGATEIFLEVGEKNQTARSVYDGLGFRLVGRRKHYYAEAGGESQDGLVLKADLPLGKVGGQSRGTPLG
ncbi:MAG TPA: ribosomal protein S18-alanine N-acetyltransferase [Rhizomicrobium sp.]|jgi:ribosomal-protein-alanine N-acetyltransferase